MKNRPEMPAAARQPIGESGEIGEDDLILHYYGEAADPRAIEQALAESADLRRRYAELARDLAAATTEMPEPPADLAARVWRELRPRLERQPPGCRHCSAAASRPPGGTRAGPWPPPRSPSSRRSPSATSPDGRRLPFRR